MSFLFFWLWGDGYTEKKIEVSFIFTFLGRTMIQKGIRVNIDRDESAFM